MLFIKNIKKKKAAQAISKLHHYILLFSISIVLISILLLVLVRDQTQTTRSKAEYQALPVLLDILNVKASVFSPNTPRSISKYIWGVNHAHKKGGRLIENYFYANQGEIQKIKDLGIKMIRFPGGCSTIGYDWKNAKMHWLTDNGEISVLDHMSVDEALLMADKVGAELLYLMNIEALGVPNPCGQVSAYPFPHNPPRSRVEEAKAILLQDAVDLVTRYKGRIKYYELGNESWGSWHASEYVDTMLEFAKAIKNVDPTIVLGLTGHPTTGNNMDPAQPYQDKDRDWTINVQKVLNEKCGVVDCFDFITDHPYVWAGYHPLAQNYRSINFKGKSAYYPLTNYSWIFAQRTQDYTPKKLAVTEWNVKCWGNEIGTTSNYTKKLKNASFEDGKNGWGFWSRNENTGYIEPSTEEKHDGDGSLKIVMNSYNPKDTIEYVQAAQQFNVTPEKKLFAYAWVKTDKPVYAELVLQQMSEGEHFLHHIAESTLKEITPNTWEPVLIGGVNFEDSTKAQVVLRITKTRKQWETDPSSVTVYFDKVQVDESPIWGFTQVASCSTVEQGMFIFDSLLEMVQNNIYIGNYHDYSKKINYGCALFNDDFTQKPSAQAFAFSSVLAGGELLETNVQSPMFFVPLDSSCDKPGCLRGGVQAPYVSVYSGFSQDHENQYIFIVNRHQSKKASVSLDLTNTKNISDKNVMSIDVLLASDYEDKQFLLQNKETQSLSTPQFQIEVEPISITRIKLSSTKAVRREEPNPTGFRDVGSDTITPAESPSHNQILDKPDKLQMF